MTFPTLSTNCFAFRLENVGREVSVAELVAKREVWPSSSSNKFQITIESRYPWPKKLATQNTQSFKFILKNHDSDETGRNEKLSRPNENSQTVRKDRFVIQNSDVTLKTNLERNNYVILNFRFFKPSKPSVSKITSSRIWVHSDGCRRVWSRQINLGQCAKSFL